MHSGKQCWVRRCEIREWMALRGVLSTRQEPLHLLVVRGEH